MPITMTEEDEVPSAPLWVWLGLSAIAAASFWFQAVLTEELFVPALNVIATGFKIPDDIAGATLMAAGASSPELFSSIVALFITHSALGLGTIVGSEIFNQLCICAGAVFAAKSGKLELDRAILIREVGFYALGIALFGYALRDTRPDPEDDGQLHIYISFGESVLVFGGYVLYVLVCANMDTIVDFCEALSYACKRASRRGQQAQQQLDGATMSTYGALSLTASEHEYSKRASFQLEDMPFLREARLCKEPSSNFVTFYRTQTGEKAYRTRTSQGESSEDHTFTKSIASSIRRAIGTYSDGAALRGFDFLVHSQRPSNERSVYDMEVNTFEDRLSCFMWQQSYFYSNARYSTKAWHLRWFTLTPSHLYSVPDRAESHKYRVKYPPFQEIEVDEKRLILRLINPEEGKRDFYLLAPSMEILEAFVMKMEAIIDYHKTTPDDGVTAAMESTRDEEYGSEGGGDNAKLIDFPFGGSAFEIVFFCILFPLRFILHWTVPDVRTFDEHGNPTATLGKAFAAIGVCLIWLVVGSYAMVASLESLAALMDIPDAVVGVTVSAAGTSLPNYVASKVAAQNGFGNMAVSNAFGSNTFNIMVGLGLPWVLYTSFGSDFQTYHGLRDEGITQSVVILALVLLVFLVLVVPSNFVIYRWHGIVFILLYVLYLVFAIGQV